MIFLDTNAVIGFLAGQRHMRARFGEAVKRSEEIAISSVVAFELEFGVARSGRPEQNRAGLDAFFERVPILPFSTEAARAAGEIRAYLRSNGTPVGPYDVLIAGHALSEGAVLVTNNRREFARIPGLKIEDWLSP